MRHQLVVVLVLQCVCKMVAQVAMGEGLAGGGDDDDEACDVDVACYGDGDVAGARWG